MKCQLMSQREISPSPQPSGSPTKTNYQPSAKSPLTLENFMSLPPEIRNIIYECILAYPPSDIIISKEDQAVRLGWEPNLLRAASPQIHREAAPLYYHLNRIHMHISLGSIGGGDGPEELAEALGDIVRVYGVKPFSNIELTVELFDARRISLDSLRPILEVIRQTDISLLGLGKPISATNGPWWLAKDVQGAFELAASAFSKGWSARGLVVMYGRWCQERKKLGRSNQGVRKH